MVTAQDIINEARKYVGMREDPPKSNHIIFNNVYYGRDIIGANYHWCVVFLWYLFHATGSSALFYDGKKIAHVDTLASWFRKNGRLHKTPQPGDIMFINPTGRKDKFATHVGLVVKDNGNGTITTIEGNTGMLTGGNEGVEQKTRKISQCPGFGRPVYVGSAAPVIPMPMQPVEQPVVNVVTEYSTPATSSNKNSKTSFFDNSNNIVRVRTTLRVRNKPIDGIIVGFRKDGDRVTVYEARDNWYRIGINQWISGAYVESKWQGRVTPKIGLNIRNLDSTAGTKTGVYKQGTVIPLLARSQSTGWYLTPKGWVSDKYVEII